MQLDFIINKWAVWPPLSPEQDSAAQWLSDISPMLKRRLTPLAKTVFCTVAQCLDEDGMVPAVFSSAHGELAKSLSMMEMLEVGEEISPTGFSLSVHNAIAGLFSMAWKNKLQCTVLAPGEEGMAPAFIEGLGLLQEGAERVLLVFYDEPLPAFYPSSPYRLSSDSSCALALMIAKSSTGQALTLFSSALIGNDGEQPVQLPAFIRFLTEPQTRLTFCMPRRSWSWEKRYD